MLQTISKHIQGWIAGVVIAIIASVFVFWGLEYYLTQSGDKHSTVASVNGDKIAATELDKVYDILQRTYLQQGAALNDQVQQQLRAMALQQLILDRVLLQTANQLGFSVSDQQIQQEILQIPAFQEQGQFSMSRFQSVLNSSGMAPEVFLQSVRGSLLVDQLSLGLQHSGFVTAIEATQVYGLLHQQRNFGYFLLPVANFSTAVQPTDAQIQDYYEQHQGQFRTPEQVKVAYLLLSPENLKAEVKVNPTDVQQFYQDNASEFAGKPLEAVKADIERRLFQQQLNQLLAAKGEQLNELTYTNPTSLAEAAKTLGLTMQTSSWMSSQGIKGDVLFSDPKVLGVIFSDEVLKQNNNSQPIELKDGSFLVVRIAQHQESQLQGLAAVRDQIKTQLQKEQGQKQAGLQAYQIQHALETGETPAAVAKRYHLTWIEKTGVTRQDKTLPPQLLQAVFNLAPSTDPAKKVVNSILLPDSHYAIILLQGFRNATVHSDAAAEMEKLRAALAKRWGELDYQLLAKSALNKAKVKNFTVSR